MEFAPSWNPLLLVRRNRPIPVLWALGRTGWFALCYAVDVDTFLTSSPTVTLFVPLCVFLGVLVFSVVLGGRVNTVALRHPSDVVQTIKLR